MSRGSDFWSRRRAGVEAEQKAETLAVDAQIVADQHAALEEKSDAEVLAELELPDPDAMNMGDDFSAFMSKAVPDRLRRRALRKLWLSNPVLANVDSLVDYGEDFTDSATVIENMQTTYQIGKGMLKHVEEMARQAADAETVEAAVETDETETNLPDETADDAVDLPEQDEISDELDQVFAIDDEGEDVASISTVAPRRMKFRPEETAA